MGQCVSVAIHGKGDRVEILSTSGANPDSEGDSIFSVVEALIYGILMLRPSKPDSAPVRGDGYEPASLRIQQSRRRDVAQRVGRSWWWWLNVVSGSEKFLHGMVRSRKLLLLVPFIKQLLLYLLL
jgi:hypothetical protein